MSMYVQSNTKSENTQHTVSAHAIAIVILSVGLSAILVIYAYKRFNISKYVVHDIIG